MTESDTAGDVTGLLVEWSNGDKAALDKLTPLVYDELHRLAARYLSHERVGHTLQATALVHEAFVRLVDQRRVQWQNSLHFVALAAQMMRRILVDHARSHGYAKRGGGAMNDLDTEVRSDDIVTTYSGRGPSFIDHVVKPDLVAPGNRIVSTLAPDAEVAELYPDNLRGAGRIELSGSSQATAVVTGAVALLLERDPFLTNDQIKAILMHSADKLEGADVFAVGAGYLQVVRAIAFTGAFRPVYFNSTSPIVVRNDEGGFELVNAANVQVATSGDTALWTDMVLWGDTALWSDVALWGDTALGSDIALWGDTALWSDIALWGDTALWSDTALWGDVALWGDTALWTDTALWSDAILGSGD